MSSTSSINELLDVYDVARLSGLKTHTIYGLVGRCAIPSVKIGGHARLFRRSAVLLWLRHRERRHSGTGAGRRSRSEFSGSIITSGAAVMRESADIGTEL